MVNATELRNGSFFKEDGNLYQVLNYEHIKMGRGSGTIKVRVKNLKTGSNTEKGFITGARVEEAEVEKRKVSFLYKDSDSYNFMDPLSFDQFSLLGSVIGEEAKYLRESLEVLLIVSDAEALGIELPNTIVYKVSETGPEEKGNTVSSVYKEAVLDNNLIVKVPMFIRIGDKVKIDTRSGQYMERVK